MARRVSTEVSVRCGPDGTPLEFVRDGRPCRNLRTVEVWRESGCWWDGGPARTVFRMQDGEGRVFELHRLLPSLFPLETGGDRAGSWVLYRVED